MFRSRLSGVGVRLVSRLSVSHTAQAMRTAVGIPQAFSEKADSTGKGPYVLEKSTISENVSSDSPSILPGQSRLEQLVSRYDVSDRRVMEAISSTLQDADLEVAEESLAYLAGLLKPDMIARLIRTNPMILVRGRKSLEDTVETIDSYLIVENVAWYISREPSVLLYSRAELEGKIAELKKITKSSSLLVRRVPAALGIVANIKLLQSLGVGEELNTIITNCPGALSQESIRLEASFRTLWSLTSDKALVKRVIRKSPSLLRRGFILPGSLSRIECIGIDAKAVLLGYPAAFCRTPAEINLIYGVIVRIMGTQLRAQRIMSLNPRVLGSSVKELEAVVQEFSAAHADRAALQALFEQYPRLLNLRVEDLNKMLTLLEEFGFSRSESLLLPQALLRNRSELALLLQIIRDDYLNQTNKELRAVCQSYPELFSLTKTDLTNQLQFLKSNRLNQQQISCLVKTNPELLRYRPKLIEANLTALEHAGWDVHNYYDKWLMTASGDALPYARLLTLFGWVQEKHFKGIPSNPNSAGHGS